MKYCYSHKSTAEKLPYENSETGIEDDETVIDVFATFLDLSLIRPGKLVFFADVIDLFDLARSVLKELLELYALSGPTTFQKLNLLVKLQPWKGFPRLFSQCEKETAGGAGVTAFTRLFLQHCFIRYFSPKIQCLKELECLDLSSNEIQMLSAVISSSNLLISFKAAAAGEQTEPPSILFSFQKIESLNLSHKRFMLLASPNRQLVLMGSPAAALPAADEALNFASCFCPLGYACDKKPIHVEEDRLSNLPDEILIMILSLLPLKEGAKTSILSRRWISLWTHTTRLEFDNYKKLALVRRGEVELSPDVERRSFFEMVHNVLQSHRALVIETFKVCSGLVPETCFEIDSWIEFALRKRVKTLQLYLTNSFSMSGVGSYHLPIRVFRNNCLDCLNSLSLTKVHVTGDVLEYILTACPSLEILHVARSLSLVTLKVPGPLLKLRILSIMHCSEMESMDVSGINISSLTYRGRKIRLSVKDAPSIVKVDVGGPYSSFFMQNIYYFCRHLSELEMLVLDLKFKGYRDFASFPILQNLKELILYVDSTYSCYGLLPHTSIFPSCPVLQRFELKFSGMPPSDVPPWLMRNQAVPKVYGHKKLKVVKMEGFVGCKVEFEFVRFILKNVPSLKKLIMDPQSEFLLAIPGETDKQLQRKTTARALARALEHSLPEGVELVIL